MPIEVENLSKAFGEVTVLKALTETFAEGEISVLLGASGCGKTTTLRCIAGLEQPNGGRITIDGRIVYQDRPAAWVPVERRQVSMVFQSYAIWPHMTVFQNVSLPLQAAGADRDTTSTRVAEVLDLVGLRGVSDRSATQLSGGQQQRVALARCIVSQSPVILMDEPLSNLDARLRVTMRAEIGELQRRLKRTILFVTHDQEEAMSIADTIYLFHEGKVLQKGRPKEVYENPLTRYAAEFLGRANVISDARWTTGASGEPMVRLGDIDVPMAVGARQGQRSICIRPEKWRAVAPDASGVLKGRIVKVQYVGDRNEFAVDTRAGQMTVVELSDQDRQIGDVIGLRVDPRDVKLLA